MNKPLAKSSPGKRPLKAFLCHAHADRALVHSLYARLKKDGMEVWLDREKLLAGQDWEHEIRKAILKSDVIIVCISHGFNKQKGFRHQELRIALEKANLLPDDGIFVVPLRLEECDMPESLQYLHRVDLFETGGYKKLIRSLRRHVG